MEYLTEEQFWNGFSLVNCVPGPLFNIAAYIGAVMDGFIGALFSWVALITPAFFMIFGVLPFWNKFRHN